MASPFFSGRIPQELYNRVDQHVKESGEGKTQILINALSQYLGIEISKPISSNANTDLFLSELESLKERVSSLERSQSQQMLEPIKIAETPHKQMSLLDHATNNNDNSTDNAEELTKITDNTDNSTVIGEQILTTQEVEGLMGINRQKLDRTKEKDLFPLQSQGYEVIGYAGKHEKSPYSNLWTVITLTKN